MRYTIFITLAKPLGKKKQLFLPNSLTKEIKFV